MEKEKRHTVGALFMLGAVLSFSLGDTTTKLLTLEGSTLPILAVRCFFGLLYTYLACKILKINIPKDIFINPIILGKSAIFVITIYFFAISFKYNSFTAFYAIFFVFLPIFSIALSYYFRRRVPSLIYIAVVIFMCAAANYSLGEDLGSLFSRESLLPIGTAFFYACYLAYGEFVSDAVEIDSFSQELPSLLYGAIAFLLMSALGSEFVEVTGFFSSFEKLTAVMAASAFSVVGLICINRATAYEDSEKVAPYEYSLMIYAWAIDYYVFELPISEQTIIGSVGVLIGAVILSRLRDTNN